MIKNHNLTSLLIPSQLPEHIRDDPSYANFIAFLQAYYEWLEQDGNVSERTKNLLKYKDIDSSTSEFLNYFYNDFLSYFPEELLADKTEVVKLAKELYKSKGTPASYQLLFRILYNMDVDFFYTKDAVIKASDGKWYVAKSLKLATDLVYVSTITYNQKTISVKTYVPNGLTIGDTFTLSGTKSTTNEPNGTWTVHSIVNSSTFTFMATNAPTGTINITNASVYIPNGFANKNFLKTQNLRIFGETTKTIATIENSVIVGKRVEVFISNINRLFESGEYIRIVDSNNRDVLFDGRPLRAKILGQISQIKINPANRGLLYQVNDPVIVYGGLNTPSGIGAEVTVKETTSGAIQRIKVETGGYGFTKFNSDKLPGTANTRLNISNAPGAQAHVTVDDNPINPKRVDVSFIPIDRIGKKSHLPLGNTSSIQPYYFEKPVGGANVNSTLADTFNFTSFSTYPISSVIVDNGGGGIKTIPLITADSLYAVEDSTPELAIFANLKSLGILAPIQIIDGGHGYVINDTINIIGGTGYNAHANVTSVSANGNILSIKFVQKSGNITLGGMGYTIGEILPTLNVANTEVLSTIRLVGNYKLGSGLPSLSINSANTQAANAVLVVPGLLGDGAFFTPTLDRVGSITSFNISHYGEDYISTPNVSFKVQDIIVKGLTLQYLPSRGDIVYQGILNSSYVSIVDSIKLLIPNNVPTDTLYRLRVFNYNAKPDYYLPLEIHNKDRNIIMTLTNQYNTIEPDERRDISGVLTYGDGTAKAYAKFLNGLTISDGQYLDTTGHPSSFSVLQSIDYNNFTYKITVEKEIDKYRKTLLDLLHPTGMKVIGRYALKSEAKTKFDILNALQNGQLLSHYTGNEMSNVSMSLGSTDLWSSNNIVKFDGLGSTNLNNFITTDSVISFTTANGDGVHSEVISVNSVNNTIVLRDNVWLNFANVAYVTGNVDTNIIHISSITNSYNIINNGEYSNTKYPLKDIVRTGDKITVANNTYKTVSDVDYANNIIYLSTNLTSNVVSSMNVKRTLIATAEFVKIFTPVGQQYNPVISDELGNSILTEDGSLLILG